MDAQAARDRLVRATRSAKKRLFSPLYMSSAGEVPGVINGVIGRRDFSLRFIPYHIPGRDEGEGDDPGEDDPDDTVRVVDGPIPGMEYWMSPTTTFVGEIENTESGCRIRGRFRPGGFALVFPLMVAASIVVPELSDLGWSTIWIVSAVLLILGIAYWLAAALSNGDKRGRGILRFLDDVFSFGALKKPKRMGM